jgi:hypothetical protein
MRRLRSCKEQNLLTETGRAAAGFGRTVKAAGLFRGQVVSVFEQTVTAKEFSQVSGCWDTEVPYVDNRPVLAIRQRGAAFGLRSPNRQ